MSKRSLLLAIIVLIFINLSTNAQQRLQHLINEFKSSIELPEYYKGKQLMTRSPYEVKNMNIENGILTFQYTSGNQSYTNSYSIEIDLRKVETKKGAGYNYNAWFENPGSVIVRKTGNKPETILVDWFTFSCKSEGMRDKVYNELVSMQAPFKPKTNLHQKQSSNKSQKTDSQTLSVSKKSKSGKYAQ